MAYTPRDPYTDQRRTRIYQRDNSPAAPDTIGQTQAIPKQTKLFDGISVAQIIAGAAAAATSVALASKIGIAGSVIGAAVSSVVTVLSSQLYRKFLQKSAEKIKAAASFSAEDRDHDLTNVLDRPDFDGTEQIASSRGARLAPTKLRARAAAERAATQRKVIVFSILAAAAAVVLSAGIIWFATAGEGLGAKATPFAPVAKQSNNVTPAPQKTREPEDSQPQANDTAPKGDDSAQPQPPATPSTPPATDTTSPEKPGTSDGSASGGAQDGSEVPNTPQDNQGPTTPSDPQTPEDGPDTAHADR